METVEQRETRIAALAERRALSRGGEERALTRSTLPAVMFPMTDAGEVVTPRSALAIADAYACVRALADTAASLPLHVYRRRPDGGRERVENATAGLLRRPAPAVTQAAFVAQAMAHLNLWGEAFVGVYRDETGAAFQLGLISPERVEVEVLGGMPRYTITFEDGRRGTYGPDDVIHVKGLSLDGLRGLSPVAQARQALGLSEALTKHGASTFRNGATPLGVLKVPPGPAGEEQMENLKRGWEGRHGGPDRAGRVAVLSGEISFEAVAMPLHDAQWLQSMEMSSRMVARIFRVPPWVIAASTSDSLTYATVSEQMRAFVLTGLKPHLVAVEQALAAHPELFPPEAGTYCAFELDAMLRGDPKARADVYEIGLRNRYFTVNEVRGWEDLPALPDGDQPTVPATPPSRRVMVRRDDAGRALAFEEAPGA